MLQKDTSGNQKMMILLTDGVPTFSYKVTEASTINNTVYGTKFDTSSIDQPGDTSQLVGSRYTAGNDPNVSSLGCKAKW